MKHSLMRFAFRNTMKIDENFGSKKRIIMSWNIIDSIWKILNTNIYTKQSRERERERIILCSNKMLFAIFFQIFVELQTMMMMMNKQTREKKGDGKKTTTSTTTTTTKLNLNKKGEKNEHHHLVTFSWSALSLFFSFTFLFHSSSHWRCFIPRIVLDR